MLNEKLKILITFASIGKIYFTIEQKLVIVKKKERDILIEINISV